MRMRILLLTLLAVATVGFTTADAHGASAAGVFDEAGFFSPDAVAKANQAIQAARSKHNKDLRIETYAQIPADRASRYAPAERERFYSQWADERGKAAGVDGVMVIATRDPSYL